MQNLDLKRRFLLVCHLADLSVKYLQASAVGANNKTPDEINIVKMLHFI